jgi:predicted aminopeptidase
MSEESKQVWAWIYRILATALPLALMFMWGCPNYRVYQQNLEGEAELARATQNRQITIQEAQAKKESAHDLAEAEIIRAGGVARANEIIGQSLKNNESYLRYLWIDNMDKTANQVIYIPTEAGLPILESSRLKNKNPNQ